MRKKDLFMGKRREGCSLFLPKHFGAKIPGSCNSGFGGILEISLYHSYDCSQLGTMKVK